MNRFVFMFAVSATLMISGMAASGSWAGQIRVEGRLVDSYCHAVAGVSGDNHRQCAVSCVEKGIPAALLEKGTGKLFVLLPEKDSVPLPSIVLEKMESSVAVSGRLYEQGGVRFIRIERVD